MKKTILISLLIICMNSAFSQETRVVTLGYNDTFFQLDSTHIIIPVEWRTSGKYSSSKIERSTTYYYKNLLFYNCKTDQSTTLFKDSVQMFKLEYERDLAVNRSSVTYTAINDTIRITQAETPSQYKYVRVYSFDGYLLYRVINEDFNADGKLSGLDPVYLYASNYDGTGLLQITPRGYDVANYQYFQKEHFILATMTCDINNDKKFNSDDKELIFRIDLLDFSKSHFICGIQISQ
jgi:hypothetical protein